VQQRRRRRDRHRPGERSNLTLSPRSDIGESREVPQVFWQRGNHGIKLRTFKEPLADILFREPTNVWGRDDFIALDTKFEGLSKQLCLLVGGSGRPPVFLQTAINVGVNAPGCHVDSPQVAECLVDRLQMCFELSQRLTAATCVFLFQAPRAIHRGTPSRRVARTPAILGARPKVLSCVCRVLLKSGADPQCTGTAFGIHDIGSEVARSGVGWYWIERDKPSVQHVHSIDCLN
jgi:hypothetical protein